MGHVTGAMVARSRLALPPDATPDRRRHVAATTIQQTRLRRYGGSVPQSAKPCYFREFLPLVEISNGLDNICCSGWFSNSPQSEIEECSTHMDRHCATYRDDTQGTTRDKPPSQKR